jgi:hypothetical protein
MRWNILLIIIIILLLLLLILLVLLLSLGAYDIRETLRFTSVS